MAKKPKRKPKFKVGQLVAWREEYRPAYRYRLVRRIYWDELDGKSDYRGWWLDIGGSSGGSEKNFRPLTKREKGE